MWSQLQQQRAGNWGVREENIFNERHHWDEPNKWGVQEVEVWLCSEEDWWALSQCQKMFEAIGFKPLGCYK